MIASLNNDVEKREEIDEREEYIDYLNVEISRYIVHVMSTEAGSQDLVNINGYYTVVGNLERIGDHAMNIAGYASNLKSGNRLLRGSAFRSRGRCVTCV